MRETAVLDWPVFTQDQRESASAEAVLFSSSYKCYLFAYIFFFLSNGQVISYTLDVIIFHSLNKTKVKTQLEMNEKEN